LSYNIASVAEKAAVGKFGQLVVMAVAKNLQYVSTAVGLLIF